MQYQIYSLSDLLKQELLDCPVEVEGIPRGATKAGHEYDSIYAYLQDDDQFVFLHGRHMYSGMPGPALALLRAASEADERVTVRGIYSTKCAKGQPGELRMHEVSLRNVGIEFELK